MWSQNDQEAFLRALKAMQYLGLIVIEPEVKEKLQETGFVGRSWKPGPRWPQFGEDINEGIDLMVKALRKKLGPSDSEALWQALPTLLVIGMYSVAREHRCSGVDR